MKKKVKLILALMALIEYGAVITPVDNYYIVRGNQHLFGTAEEDDMLLSEEHVIEVAETYCKPY